MSAAPTMAAVPQHQGVFSSHFGHHTQPQPGAPVYMPAAATTQGYQQYLQYAHNPQYHGVQLTQQAFVAADTNHDGKVSQAEVQYATPTYQPAMTYTPAAATAQGYQQYVQYAHQPGYHGLQLSQQAYVHADTNHDGRVSQAELQYATAQYQPQKGECSMEINNIKVTGGKLAKSGMFDKADPYVYFHIDTPGWFHSVKGQTTAQKGNTQPNWAGEVVKMEKFDKPETLSLEVTIYDKDLLKDDKLGMFKVELAPLYKNGHIKEKVDNNLFAEDVYLEFDYTTTWGPEPPKSKKKKKSGCC